jgi:hypothetical protein
MAITVNTYGPYRVGGLSFVINEVTGDGSLKTWDTGLGKVLWYGPLAEADSHITVDTWYLNYSDNGSTARPGAVCFNTAAPDSGEILRCLGIGLP